jgi:two-component system NarL family sensor kinase
MAYFSNFWNNILYYFFDRIMEVEKVIIISVISGTAFTLGIILVVIGLSFSFRKKRILQQQEFELELKNKELEKMAAVVQAQEQERAKIARNLHDEVGSILSMANRNLKCIIQQVPEKVDYKDDLDSTLEILEQSVDKIRSISHNMIPHFLVKFGLVKTLTRLVEQTEKALGNSCTFESKLVGDLVINQQHEINFYSIVLELFNNLMKHARPDSVSLVLEKQKGNLVLIIQHDGVAITQADYEYLLDKADGLGLESISLRLKIISGELEYKRQNKGGAISLSMPLNNQEKHV